MCFDLYSQSGKQWGNASPAADNNTKKAKYRRLMWPYLTKSCILMHRIISIVTFHIVYCFEHWCVCENYTCLRNCFFRDNHGRTGRLTRWPTPWEYMPSVSLAWAGNKIDQTKQTNSRACVPTKSSCYVAIGNELKLCLCFGRYGQLTYRQCWFHVMYFWKETLLFPLSVHCCTRFSYCRCIFVCDCVLRYSYS